MARCSLCGAPAIAYVPVQRRYLCAEHFAEYVEGKVERALRRHRMVSRGDLVVAAVSGGKDSAALLGSLSRLRDKLGFRLVAFHVDLGIGEYSRRSRLQAERLAKATGVPLAVFSVPEELGYGIPELAFKARRPPCSVCGAVKRYLYNAAAIEAGAQALATGHNADDLAAYAVKNFLMQDLEAIGKLAPVTPGIPGLAAKRIRPLYYVYEKEAFLYVLARGLPYLHEECPHARLDSLEFTLKRTLNKLEEDWPGLKQGFLAKLAKRAKDYPSIEAEAVPCRHCGLLSSTGECSFCRLTRRILGEPMGERVRGRLREIMAGALAEARA